MDEEHKRLRLVWSHENRAEKIVGWLQILLAIVTGMMGIGFVVVGAASANAIFAFVAALFMFITGAGTLKKKF